MKKRYRIILDLCGGTGSWSRPYREAGYDVRVITTPEFDVREFTPPDNVYGILAAPPCTDFSKAMNFRNSERNIERGLEVVDACLRIIRCAELSGRLKFWAMENPKGFLRRILGIPPLTYNPCDFGDPWTKPTDLWGRYRLPIKTPVEPTIPDVIRHSHRLPNISRAYQPPPGEGRRKARRSMTPSGFARAFFMANK